MKTYKILWDNDSYGSIIIQANTPEEAREKFESGDYKEEELNYKNGGIQFTDIEEIK